MYEADLNFSLMPAIEALLKPDEEDAPKAKKATNHRRRHNMDFCFACSGVGELICCDYCPASFHLECHDPPLDDLPEGQWLCRSCKTTTEQKKKPSLIKSGSVDSRLELLSGGQTRASRPSTPARDQENLLMVLGGARKIFPKRCTSEAPLQRLSLAVEPKTSPDSLISPWDQLVKAASQCNPRKFELPREMAVHQLFPGDEKGELRSGKNTNRSGRNGNGSSSNSSTGSRSRGGGGGVENATSALPAKSCFSCRKSCSRAPLISCDFCPLFFHQDCLDPPMTALPTTMWMCPVHPHQITDWKNISSMAATERVKLWSKFNPTVDQDTVKAQFLHRVHSDRQKTRFKVKPRMRAAIPPMVQYHYQNPLPLMVSVKSLHRLRELEQRERIIAEVDRMEEPSTASEMARDIEEDIRALKEAHQLAEGKEEENEEKETKDQQLISTEQPPEATANKSVNLLQDLQEKVKTERNLMSIFEELQEQGQLEELLKEIRKSVVKTSTEDQNSPEKPPPSQINAFSTHHNHHRRRRPIQPATIQSRAVLTPILGNPLDATPPQPILELSVQMRYRKLAIGTLASNDLQLDGRCPQQSEKHAIIFYDEFTRSFELLNYSEHGTEVNGMLYSLHVAGARKSEPERKRRAARKPDVREMICEVIDKKRGIKRIKYGELGAGTEMAAPETPSDNSFCNCAWRPPLAEGWEGSAVLQHGYLLNFGCQSFVFSVPDPFEVDGEEE